MTIGVVTVFPYFHEVVLIDIALIIVGTDTGTSSNRAISHHRTYRDTSLTREETGTHLAFIIAKEPLTSIIHLDATFLSRLLQILKNATKLLIRQPHHRIKGCTTYREDSKEAPAPDTLRNQKILDFIEFWIVTTIHTCDDIKHETLSGNEHVDGLAHHLETPVVASHPVMVFLQSIKTDGHRTDTRPEQTLPTLGRQMQGIGDHPPRKSFFINGPSTLLKVKTHQRLTS